MSDFAAGVIASRICWGCVVPKNSSLHKWDPRSDQPSRIRDRRAKLKIRMGSLPAHLKMLLTGILVVPRVLWRYVRTDFPDHIPASDIFGIGVNIDRVPDQLPALVRELGIDRLLVRVHIGSIDRLEEYRDFLASLAPARITVSILQDRAHVEAPEDSERHVRAIFNHLGPLAENFKIGNAVNRTKWGFYSLDEYLEFYQRVQKLRDNEFPDIRLMGGSVIDFEMLPILRVLFSGHGCRFDKVASQLYVDRRGAPEGRQMGHFDLRHKIRMIAAALHCSRHPGRRLIISETNWPLEGKGRYAPASGDCCVSESLYTDYMVRYYLLALSTGLVETVYWHQLVAEGYGLVKPEVDRVHRRDAFQALKTLVRMLKNSVFASYHTREQGYHEMTFERKGLPFSVIWAERPVAFPGVGYSRLTDQLGQTVQQRPEVLSGQVYYLDAEPL